MRSGRNEKTPFSWWRSPSGAAIIRMESSSISIVEAISNSMLFPLHAHFHFDAPDGSCVSRRKHSTSCMHRHLVFTHCFPNELFMKT